MPTLAWVLLFSFTPNAPWSVIDNIGSAKSCETLKLEIGAPNARCISYEVAIPPR